MAADWELDPEKWVRLSRQTNAKRSSGDHARQTKTERDDEVIALWNNGMVMTKKEEHLAREREEIAARVASFKAMQKKFERERHEYYATTLGNAWDGFTPRSP